MKTAEEIIVAIEGLPPEEVEKVWEYLNSVDDFRPTEYPSEVLEEIARNVEEAKRGINVSPTFSSMDEAIKWLHMKEDE
ncbi:MAG: hypothetical protein C4527_28920 [Candidatus Omnitrophota bacterium]|jgi:hypothetical protein|nr:MAG: hypothetical protein C4527_28920 [Candidatus Omnitrophota bacterium]